MIINKNHNPRVLINYKDSDMRKANHTYQLHLTILGKGSRDTCEVLWHSITEPTLIL